MAVVDYRLLVDGNKLGFELCGGEMKKKVTTGNR
jgi:hypothetical protein